MRNSGTGTTGTVRHQISPISRPAKCSGRRPKGTRVRSPSHRTAILAVSQRASLAGKTDMTVCPVRMNQRCRASRPTNALTGDRLGEGSPSAAVSTSTAVTALAWFVRRPVMVTAAQR